MEGQSFEKQHETSKPETGPEISIESILERGEIEEREDYLGYYWPIQRIKIKDDGIAFFKTETKEPESSYYARGDYETIAIKLDRLLGFNIVPTSVKRTIKDDRGIEDRGIMECFIDDAEPAIKFSIDWPTKTTQQEIVKAAVFDYLIGARDRHLANFLINPETGKIWLIDHAVYMFETGRHGSLIHDEARGKEIPKEILLKLVALLEKLDSVPAKDIATYAGEKVEVSSIWRRIKENAVALVNAKVIL